MAADMQISEDRPILFKAPLSEQMIREYRLPLGTRLCGTNCAICSMSMLGFLSPQQANAGTEQCRLRQAPAEFREIQAEVQRVLGPSRTISQSAPARIPDVLTYVMSQLENGEATIFNYGLARGAHSVLLRKNDWGDIELIDPQRGLKDIGSHFGFSVDFLRTHESIEMTPNYYRVTGRLAIENIILEQSVLFRFGTHEDMLHMGVGNVIYINLPLPTRVAAVARAVHPITGRSRKTRRRRVQR